MQTSKRITELLCLVGLLASGAALAQETRVYFGFNTAQARPSFDRSPAVAGGFPVTFDSSKGVWNAYGGFQFHPTFSAELTYYKLGDYTANLTTPTGSLYTNIQISGWGGALVGTLPLSKGFSLLGRVGTTYVRETRGNCTVCAGTVSESSSNIWSPTLGVGLKYDITPNWGARAEYTHFTKIGSNNDSTFGGTLNLWSAGVSYRF